MTTARSHIDPHRAAITKGWRIELPFIHDDDLERIGYSHGHRGSVLVEPRSPMWLRRIGGQFARYFSEETGFGLVWSAYSSEPIIVLLPSRITVGDGQHYSGAVAVDPVADLEDDTPGCAVAEWFYLHPFDRGRRIIDTNCPPILQRWPDIVISGPFTSAGKATAMRLGSPLIRDIPRTRTVSPPAARPKGHR